MSKRVVVSGADGQLASCFKTVANQTEGFDFYFASHGDMDITSSRSVKEYFSRIKPDIVINTAAYTDVDGAESNAGEAERVNAYAPKVLALEAERCGAELIHISTDYVFDGSGYLPYTEEDRCNPKTVYGITKFRGEKNALNYCTKTTIIRTSWLYSEYGKNFVKTILRLAAERDRLSVVYDQKGSPTYAGCLVNAVIGIISADKRKYGEIYNFSNEGECSWYEFAKKIVQLSEYECVVEPVGSEDYPTKAVRPDYSVLSKAKIKRDYNLDILDWKTALRNNFNYIVENI